MSSTGGGSISGTLTTATSTSQLQITGLASGLNTNAIIQAELAEAELPITNMQAQVGGLQTINNTLTAMESSLTTVGLDAQALGDPTLFHPTQAVNSSNSALVGATSTNGVGAVIGGTTVTVAALASAAQRTFNFTSPSSNDTITIDGTAIQAPAGSSAQNLVDSINSNNSVDVWASVGNAGQIVLSSRTTGDQTGSWINVSDPGSTLTED